jgi:hypothetical protein
MQGIDDWIPARAVLAIARRQEDDRITVDGVSLEIALERLAVNLDALDNGRTGARDHIGHVRLHLRETGERTRRNRQRGRQQR